MSDSTLSSRAVTVAGIRACMIVYSLYPEDPRVSKEAKTLVREGVDVDVICLARDGQPLREKIDGVRVLRIPFEARRGRRLRYVWLYTAFLLLTTAAIAREWKRSRYDVVHVHSLPDFLVLAAAIPRAMGARVILDLHEAMPELLAARFRLSDKAPLVRIARLLERVSAEFADEVFVVNDAIRDLLIKRGIPAQKLTVLPNTPDEENDVPASRQTIADRYSLRTEHVIVVAGGINPERDLETLIRSLALPPLAGSVGLLLLGTGEAKYLAALHALADGLAIGNRVVFGGFVLHPEVTKLVALSDVGVVTLVDNPHTRLSVPNRLLEYTMLEKPLVVPRLPAIESFVRSRGFYYSPGNPTDLAEAIAKALADTNRARRSELSRQYESWGWAKVSRRLVEAYRRARPLTARLPEVHPSCT